MPHIPSLAGLARLALAVLTPTGAMAAPQSMLATAPVPVAPLLPGTTPLVLKDGRIAQVAIFALGFGRGSADLDGEGGKALERLAASLATDCFLTAQAIGHVAAEEAKGSDPLAGHRLARARADRVQAALTAQGLPQAAIASVWDWQFQVAQPRVTLWVFQLAAGEDCEGKPLQSATLAAPPPVPPPPSPPATPTVAAPAPAAAAPQPAAPPMEPVPAPELARLETPEPVQPASGTAPPPAARIAFDRNSSYFTAEQGRLLAGILAGLPADRPTTLVLTASIGGVLDIEAKAPDSLVYNRWLAERRAARVEEWLRRHAGGRRLAIETRYRADDASRSVELATAQVP